MTLGHESPDTRPAGKPVPHGLSGQALRIIGLIGLGGGGLTLAGCVAAAGVAAGAVAALLTGLFLTSLQASFAATAHSYAYTDFGDAVLLFDAAEGRSPSLVTFTGRLPGFHLVIITDDNDKGRPSAQETDAAGQIFETDVTIDFSHSPPTITGTITQRDGDVAFALDELYPEIDTPTIEVGTGDRAGEYEIRLHIQARTAEDEDLDYTLILNATLSSDGLFLDGTVEVERVLTPPEGQPLENSGAGDLSGTKQSDDQPEPDDQGDADDIVTNDNADQTNDNAADDTDQSTNDNEADNDNEAPSENESDNDNAGEDGLITTEDCPELPRTMVVFLNDLLGELGTSAFDVDGDGAVTADEVHEVADPFIVLTDEAVTCIIRVLNE